MEGERVYGFSVLGHHSPVIYIQEPNSVEDMILYADRLVTLLRYMAKLHPDMSALEILERVAIEEQVVRWDEERII